MSFPKSTKNKSLSTQDNEETQTNGLHAINTRKTCPNEPIEEVDRALT